jgi:hypothetical protein
LARSKFRLLKKNPAKLLQDFFLNYFFNPNYAVGIVGQQSFSIISRARGLFWIEVIVNYYEIRNGISACPDGSSRDNKNEVE